MHHLATTQGSIERIPPDTLTDIRINLIVWYVFDWGFNSVLFRVEPRCSTVFHLILHVKACGLLIWLMLYYIIHRTIPFSPIQPNGAHRLVESFNRKLRVSYIVWYNSSDMLSWLHYPAKVNACPSKEMFSILDLPESFSPPFRLRSCICENQSIICCLTLLNVERWAKGF